MYKKTFPLASVDDNDSIRRGALDWLNTCPLKPMEAKLILGKTSGFIISSIQGAVKTKEYIYGGYLGQYQFDIVYRLIAPHTEDILAADDLLDKIGKWMETNVPACPPWVNWWRIKRDTLADFAAAYDNNAEDHTIRMTITYEVI